jgi:hypothetical protein
MTVSATQQRRPADASLRFTSLASAERGGGCTHPLVRLLAPLASAEQADGADQPGCLAPLRSARRRPGGSSVALLARIRETFANAHMFDNTIGLEVDRHGGPLFVWFGRHDRRNHAHWLPLTALAPTTIVAHISCTVANRW